MATAEPEVIQKNSDLSSSVVNDTTPKEETVAAKELNSQESVQSELPEASIEIGNDAVATITLQELENTIQFNPQAKDKLTQGVVQAFLPQMQSTRQLLSELTRNQGTLLETLQQENAKFNECDSMKELVDLFAAAKRYHLKLVAVKKEMVNLHEKSTKLRRRALKLQNEKMKENLKKEQQKERELEHERQLTARPAKELREKKSE
ncbi:biogenesis of lysosome-related organelles complex 1 subunit 6-like [Saccoglossus kowalevskii]|uniref:Biogenesis of lysosome-related organelles complex 1 subunit 6-like n=1 Tax=Saccoglossus kowalevskii TaxID=10224 RepID=A0ABM0GZY2_SACKO|nr:PREDICTED: biogenesis of lysosome-related organelles complex 1 subunit 6-like [Saccoglossus kowalevskii]